VLADKFERPMPGNAVQGAKARPKKWVIASVLVAALALGFVVVKVAAVWLAPDPLRIPGEKAVSAVALGEDGLPRGYTYARGADGEPVKVPCGPVSVVLVPGEAVPEAAGEVVDQTVSLAAEMSGLYLQESESVGDGVALVQFEFVPFEAIVQRVGYGTAETIGVTLTGYDPEGMLVSTILIDRSYFDYAWPKDPDGVVFSILHQMGHALGLGDSTNAGSLMYPDRLKDSRVTAPDVAAFAALVPKCG
jgi:hypothetical protein